MTRLAVSLGALTERVDMLKTAKMAKNATLLTVYRPVILPWCASKLQYFLTRLGFNMLDCVAPTR